jgi:hypothetical protein
MDLMSKLRLVADAWVNAHRRTDDTVSLKTLGTRAVANSKLFERKDGERMSVETFTRLTLWLGDPPNWPAALVPHDAWAALADLGVAVPTDARLPASMAA